MRGKYNHNHQKPISEASITLFYFNPTILTIARALLSVLTLTSL